MKRDDTWDGYGYPCDDEGVPRRGAKIHKSRSDAEGATAKGSCPVLLAQEVWWMTISPREIEELVRTRGLEVYCGLCCRQERLKEEIK